MMILMPIHIQFVIRNRTEEKGNGETQFGIEMLTLLFVLIDQQHSSCLSFIVRYYLVQYQRPGCKSTDCIILF